MTHQPSTRSQDNPVTVIGLGPMGLALAETLLKKGHPTTVWNRTPGRARDLVARGARLAGSVADAVAAGPLTLVCLKDYPTLYEVLGRDDGASAGRTLVNLNSGTPKEAHAAASWAAERGVSYLDGAVMVPPPLVGDPGSLFLFSGPREVFDAHRATLASLGDPRYLGDEPGLAVLHNAALLGLMYATMNGFLHATALVGSAGVRAAEFADLAVNRFLPTVVDATLAEQAPDLDAGRYPGELGTLHMNLNALEHIARTCEEQGVHTAQPRLMRDIAAQAIEGGHGGSNYLAVFEVFRKATPQTR
ncbi:MULTISPECIES: imine reductase family protein [Streptomyces]|uniref:imine reductase family protein n=1 Tax=Streptomyces TaxID=1883 RepID=UPI001360DAEE|nr:NAD(P)-binding domain-containing protein [Streptomyces sp. SID724]